VALASAIDADPPVPNAPNDLLPKEFEPPNAFPDEDIELPPKKSPCAGAPEELLLAVEAEGVFALAGGNQLSMPWGVGWEERVPSPGRRDKDAIYSQERERIE